MSAPTAEPILNLKQLYDRTEQFWTQPLQTLFGTETFVTGLSATRESVLTQQKATREMLERHWDTLRLPTKTDHARLAAQVVTLENKIEGLQDQLSDVQSKLDAVLKAIASSVAAPANTERPAAAAKTK